MVDGRINAAAAAAAALPGVASLTFVSGADPAALSPSDLVDAVIAAERLLAHVHGLQAGLLAELGRPQRCGDVSALVAALVDKAGGCRGADGRVDPDLLAELTRDRSVGVAASELAAVLDWSPLTARIRIEQSTRLLSALPETFAAVKHGRIDIGRARMIVDRTAVLTPACCSQVERRILPLVRGRSKGRLETLVDREVVMADPLAAENRSQHARKGREVTHRPDKDGMGVITAFLPAEAAVLVFTLVDLVAEANKGLDGRSVDQRRADAIADIADELLTHGYVDLDSLIAHADLSDGSHDFPAAAFDTADAPAFASGPECSQVPNDTADPSETKVPKKGCMTVEKTVLTEASAAGDADVVATGGGPVASTRQRRGGQRLPRALSRHGRRPHLSVTGALSTLAGMDDLPGELDGHGVITAELLRAIAASWGSVTAVGIDPVSGIAAAVGGTSYRPTQQLADQVILMSGTCRMAGCRQPAWRCDLDHVQRYDHSDPKVGGATHLGNLVPMCKFHHLVKHHTDWTPRLQPDMSVHWTTNTGHHAASYPRQFTSPGEWERAPACQNSRPATTPPENPASNVSQADPGPLPTANSGSVPSVTEGLVMIGPTVSGPTIAVRPVGDDFVESLTELEDPDTVPDPGSVEITSYRALRMATREHALRRVNRLKMLAGPAEQQRRAFIAGRSDSADPDWATNCADPDTVALAMLTSNVRAADGGPPAPPYVYGLNRPATERPIPPTSTAAVDGAPMPDEPPF